MAGRSKKIGCAVPGCGMVAAFALAQEGLGDDTIHVLVAKARETYQFLFQSWACAHRCIAKRDVYLSSMGDKTLSHGGIPAWRRDAGGTERCYRDFEKCQQTY